MHLDAEARQAALAVDHRDVVRRVEALDGGAEVEAPGPQQERPGLVRGQGKELVGAVLAHVQRGHGADAIDARMGLVVALQHARVEVQIHGRLCDLLRVAGGDGNVPAGHCFADGGAGEDHDATLPSPDEGSVRVQTRSPLAS